MASSKAAQVITVTLGGRTFRAGRRTAAHLQRTHERFAKQFPNLRLIIAQPCYNVGVPQSAGTHDKDGVLDWWITKADGSLATEADYWAVQRWMRGQGWGIWFRHTGSWARRGAWHLHGISLGCPGPLGIFVPGQIDDYHRHALGLKGQHNSGLDHSWFPANIAATVFDYPAWLDSQKDWFDMATQKELRTQADAAVKAATPAIAAAAAKELLATKVTRRTPEGKTSEISVGNLQVQMDLRQQRIEDKLDALLGKD